MICERFQRQRAVRRAIKLTWYSEARIPMTGSPCVPWVHGVREIRVKADDGTFRVIYVAKFARAIHVLHCFQKKSQKTNLLDIALAQKRYREILIEVSP